MMLADEATNEGLQTGGIIIIVICSAILLAFIAIVLIKYVFIRKSYDKQVKELDRKFSYLDALMIGQDSQYIKRLEMISRTNLLYVDVYNDFSQKFKHIYDIDDQYAKGVVQQLKSLIAAKQYRQLKNAIAEGKKAISAFEEKANELDKQLSDLIKPEEESRQVALALKEKLREIKQKYSANITDLGPVSQTFDRLFDKLDKRFMEFESLVEGAEYDEANNLLPEVDKVLTQLNNIMPDLPKLCILVSHVLPDKVKQLKQEAEDLHAKEYPLHHLMLNSEFSVYEDKIKNLRSYLSNLQLKTVRHEADALQKSIEDMHNNFLHEVEAKDYFTENCDKTYQNVLKLEKDFLKLCSFIPTMNDCYKLSDSAKNNIETLKEGIDRLGQSKRALDAYIHSSTPQAYSILQSKLEQLQKDYDEVRKGTNDYRVYIDSIKTSSEDAYSIVFAYYYRLKACEAQLKEFGIESCKKKYSESIEICYELLNDIESKIKVKPIDIEYINEKVEELKTTANSLFEDIAKDGNVIHMAESAILIANRDRRHQNDVHQQLLVCEDQFYKGNFDKAYHDVVSLIKARHVEDNQG